VTEFSDRDMEEASRFILEVADAMGHNSVYHLPVISLAVLRRQGHGDARPVREIVEEILP
jgi:hypothetical protein